MDLEIITSERRDIKQLIGKLLNRKDLFELYVANDTRPIYGSDFKYATEKIYKEMSLYLSTSKGIVSAFNRIGVPSCYIDTLGKVEKREVDKENEVITFAFDCDCVLFDNEAETVYKEYGGNRSGGF